MRESEFVIVCNNNGIDPYIALENDNVREFLKEAMSKYKECKTNAAMVALDKVLLNNF